ncbi:MAG: hypothetical protein V1910_01175 [bacterium]
MITLFNEFAKVLPWTTDLGQQPVLHFKFTFIKNLSIDKICLENKIEHRTIKFKHPWTNRMVKNFNRRIRDKIFKKYRFQTIFEMKDLTIKFINKYKLKKD